MQKKILLAYLGVCLVILGVMTFSKHTTERLRGQSASTAGTVWERILSLKHFFEHPATPSPLTHLSRKEEKEQLLLYNKQLLEEIANLKEESLRKHGAPDKALPARVIFRTFDTWHSALWINVGHNANIEGEPVKIGKNSPVVADFSLIGLVDLVEEHRSRVRLITDPQSFVAVKVVKGGIEQKKLLEQIDHLSRLLPKGHEPLEAALKESRSRLTPSEKTLCVAKGELRGNPAPARPGKEILLKGIGFNDIFLEEGKKKKGAEGGQPPPIKPGDLLVTSGLDGLFPPNLYVSTVVTVLPSKEGCCLVDLEALPTSSPLDELSLLFVLPPIK